MCESTCSRFDGGLVLEKIPGVNDLNALQNVRSFESLAIAETQDLTSLDGLENAEFRYPEGEFSGVTIRGNKKLETLEGLNLPAELDSTNEVSSIPPSFSIVANESLRSLEGLEQIEETRNVDWQITDNFVLESLDGLQNLQTVTVVSMTVDRNPELQSVQLDSLVDAAGISVNFNENLEQLRLPNLESVEFLTVTNNESLPACQVDEIAAQADVGDVDNSGNDLNATCE